MYCSLKDSLIINENEHSILLDFSKPICCDLLYRATRDGFSASAFHSKCDGKENTLTIIKNNSNYIFGGYTAAKWESKMGNGSYAPDITAFIFTLRRNGILDANKFNVRDSNTAIINSAGFGPIFGSYEDKYYCDICIKNNSNTEKGSLADFGSSYNLPDGYKHGEAQTRSYLAGNYNKWLSTEIEVYQVHFT